MESSIGKNYKPVDEGLDVIKDIEINSMVNIVSGPHKGLVGKVVALSKSKRSDTYGMSEDQTKAAGSVDQDAYVSVQLKTGGSNI